MELVDLYDNKRRPLNRVSERYGDRENQFSQIAHSWIRNSKGEFLIQKRSMNKRYYPGLWSTTGGGVDAGETSLEGAIRETKEEMGIDIVPDDIELVLSIKKHHTFLDVYLTNKDIDMSMLTVKKDEVDDVKWASADEIRSMIKNNEVTESVTIYFETFFKLLNL